MDTTTIDRLLPYVPHDIDYMRTGNVIDLFKSYAARRCVSIDVYQDTRYSISCQAIIREQGSTRITLAGQDHPYLHDWQGLHALAHLLLGDEPHDNPTHPPAHLLLADPHERDVSTLAVMVLMAWEAAPPPQVTRPFRRRQSAPITPGVTFAPLSIGALLDYLDARLAFSLPHSPRGMRMILDGRMPLLTKLPLDTIRRMTADLVAGKGDWWDDIVLDIGDRDVPTPPTATELG